MKLDIEFSTSVELSPTLKKSIKEAVKATLQFLPKTLWNKVVKQSGHCVISVNIVGLKQITHLNSHYRKKPRPTDVLSFSRLDDLKQYQPRREMGDLVICLPIAKSQARQHRQRLSLELQRLAVHGTLHLFGFDHEKSQKDEIRMFRLQDKILRSLSPLHLKT